MYEEIKKKTKIDTSSGLPATLAKDFQRISVVTMNEQAQR